MSEISKYNAARFEANIIIRGQIECLTGLHIGGSKEKLEIGGVDSPVMRHPHTKFPFIPGSSLKGKMRHLLEYSLHVVGIDGDVSDDEKVVRIFGYGADNKAEGIGPSRLIVRDCMPDASTIKMWKELDSELLYTEYKPENMINRLTSAANPRFIERIVAGSKFNFEMVYTVYRMQEGTEKDETSRIDADVKNILQAMRLLENNFLGKSGSRGYGQVRFHIAQPIVVKQDDYVTGSDNYRAAVADIKTLNLKLLSDTSLSYPFETLTTLQ
jgi:CRISPR-associated protein Csm3